MVGSHLLADFHGVASERLDDAGLLRSCLVDAAQRARLTPVAEPVIHCFDGGGVTGFILLAESHIALHTYPERGFIAIDIFSCGAADPQAALAVFREALQPGREQVTNQPRGDER